VKLASALRWTAWALPTALRDQVVRDPPLPHKRGVPDELFDLRLASMRRDRAFRSGPALFLYERAFDDILERLRQIRRSFHSALLVGVPDPSWPGRLTSIAEEVQPIDPGPLFARAAGARRMDVEMLDVEPASVDLCVVTGVLDATNDLPAALLRLRIALRPDSLLIGAIPGGDTLPRLRSAMRVADGILGTASPHVHPRIEAAALGQLLMSAGFGLPVVDVDRVRASYRSFSGLIRDLRAMGMTNVMAKRSRKPLTGSAVAAAEEDFLSGNIGGRTVETFEILHCAAWTPAE